jgi:DNA invertase Pin-like site-specific DNA recombinase
MNKPTRFVSYIRVSTVRQGESGLGLEAQREAVRGYLNGRELLAEFPEIETGKGSNALAKRPKLREALAYAKAKRATLVIAKLDRLARNVHFISGLMEAGVDFVAVDMPEANRLTLHVMAAFAEHERETIAQRTREAMAAAKARGTVMGANGKALAAKHRQEAKARLAPLSGRLLAMRAEGLTVRRIAETLNAEGVASPGGGRWHVASVHRALGRLAA